MITRLLKTVGLFVGLLVIASVSAEDCTFVPGEGSTVPSTNNVQCNLNEQAELGVTVCQFSVNGQATITLANYGSTYITEYMSLQPEDSGDGNTLVTIQLTGSVDDLADQLLYILGSLTCSVPASAPKNLWLPQTGGLGATLNVLTINFILVDDHDPAFPLPEYAVANLPETFPVGLDVLSVYDINVTASDADTPNDASSRIGFSLVDDYGGSFSVAGTSQLSLFVEKVLDFDEDNHQYDLTVIATDQGNPARSSSVALTLTITDADNLDPIFDYTFYSSAVTELNVGKQDLDMLPAAIHAFDQDLGINAAVTYTPVFSNEGDCDGACTAISAAFTINPTSGVLSIDTGINLDAVVSRVATFAVKATQVDDPRHFAIAFVSVTLPAFVTTTPVPTTTPTTGTTLYPCTDPTTDTTPPTTTDTTVECTCPTSTPCPEPTPCPTGDTTVECTCPTSTTCPEPTPCPTGESTGTTDCPKPTPCPTGESTGTTTDCPEPTPCPTECPTPTPCPTGEPTGQTPEPSPCPTECPSPTPCPTECPEPTPCPTGEPTGTTVCPEPTPCPTECPSPTPCPTNEPTGPTECPAPTPCPTGEPAGTTICPEPTPCPTECPVPTPCPTECPEPTPCPTDQPTGPTECPEPTPCPTGEPTGPTVCPEPTPCPTECPVPTPCPTDQPTGPTECPEPTPCPTGEPTGMTYCAEPTPCPTICPTNEPAAPTPCSEPAPYTTETTTPTTTTTTTTRTPRTTGTTTTTEPRSTFSPTPSKNMIISLRNVSIFTEVGTILVQMKEDSESEYTYSLTDDTGSTSKYFGIDDKTGEVYVKSPLESWSKYGLMVVADPVSDPSSSDTASLFIEVDNSLGLMVFNETVYPCFAMEGEKDNTIGYLNSYFFWTNYRTEYEITSANPPEYEGYFDVDSTTGAIKVIQALDYEATTYVDLIVTAKTDGKLNQARAVNNLADNKPFALASDQALVHVIVQDANDNAPVFSFMGKDDVNEISFGVSSYTSSGQDILQLSTTDIDTGDNKEVRYSIDDPSDNFYVGESTGLIRASVSMTSLEFADQTYEFTVTAKNVEESQKTDLHVTVYTLMGDQILMMDIDESAQDFDEDYQTILTSLSEAVGVTVQALKWEEDKRAAVSKRSVRSLQDSDDSTVTVYLYALNSDGPLGRDELLSLITEHEDAFSSNDFVVGSQIIYEDEGPLQPIDDNTTYIAAISCLAVLAGIVLIVAGVFIWKFCNKSKKQELYHPTSALSPVEYGIEKENVDSSSKNGHEKVKKVAQSTPNQAISSEYSRMSMQHDSMSPILADGDTAQLVGVASDLEALEEERQGVENPEFRDDRDEFKLENELHAAADLIENIEEPSLNELEKEPDPDPDYFKSILVDPNAEKKNDEDGRSEKSSPGVTFKETLEVISVIENNDNEDENDDNEVATL